VDSATRNFLLLIGGIIVLAIFNPTWALNVTAFLLVLLLFRALSKGQL
jgi:hypothetical protein